MFLEWPYNISSQTLSLFLPPPPWNPKKCRLGLINTRINSTTWIDCYFRTLNFMLYNFCQCFSIILIITFLGLCPQLSKYVCYENYAREINSYLKACRSSLILHSHSNYYYYYNPGCSIAGRVNGQSRSQPASLSSEDSAMLRMPSIYGNKKGKFNWQLIGQLQLRKSMNPNHKSLAKNLNLN